MTAAVLDPQGLVIGWSRAAEQLLGYTAQEVLNRPAMALVAKEQSRIVGVVEESRTGEGWSGSVPLRHRSGGRLERFLQVSPLVDSTGRTCWLVSAAGGNACGKWTGSRLIQLMFEPFVTRSPVAVAVLDTNLRYVWVNDALEYHGGLPRERRLGRCISEALPNVDVRDMETQMRRVLKSGVPILDYETKARIPTPRSHKYAWRVSFFRIDDEIGRVQGVWYMGTDVTDSWRARERLLLLNEAGARLGSTLDVIRTAKDLVEVTVSRFADSGVVDLLDIALGDLDPVHRAANDTPRMHRAAMESVLALADDGIGVGEMVHYPSDSLAARALKEDRVIVEKVPSAAKDPLGPHSVVAVPLRARGAVLGVVRFARGPCPDPFEEDDVLLAEELAARAGLCVDNARRFARERKAATVLQRSLLPRVLYEGPAAEVASRYLSATGGHGLGSDWFDVIPLSGARIALVVGDVVGHGYHAAVTMGRLRMAIRTLASLEVPAVELLARLDDLVLNMQEDEETTGGDAAQTVAAASTGARCLYVVYNPVTQRCTVARAGHPPPAVIRPNGTVDFPDLAAGPPLGLGALPFESAEFELPEGSLLALFTDGLVSTLDQGDDGLARLASALVQAEPDPEASARALSARWCRARPRTT
ncbi:SpoIIE family protein phosphatase [Streptomyces malaysiensis]|uniref:SpoIIE family protein phosphatase n=1 Tax=Streptomyces malaysiensis TaxID=92644 RepID=UPI002B2C9561|nr:SpoIIE family protein phosphatase [Streptomyces malaysiensis]